VFAGPQIAKTVGLIVVCGLVLAGVFVLVQRITRQGVVPAQPAAEVNCATAGTAKWECVRVLAKETLAAKGTS
jgi:hypothetical protein